MSRVQLQGGRAWRLLACTVGVAVCVATITPALHASASSTDTLKRDRCGTIDSTSIYSKARVIALRGVGCHKARRVAKRFDHTGDLTIGRWRCAYAHSDLPNLFSCGWPADGNLRQADHALLTRGVPGT